MEGGVTSGIIYASAVTELAKSYRFSSIGGSSIGAFAAALTAAAEYNRRRGSNVGFELMEKLPTELAVEDDQNETRLLRMFRPQDGTRRLFRIFLASLDRKSTFSRLVCGLTEAVRQYWRAVLLALGCDHRARAVRPVGADLARLEHAAALRFRPARSSVSARGSWRC